MSREDKLRVGITMGDVAGIGPEIIIKTFMDDRIFKHCTPVLFGNPKVIGYYRRVLNIDDIKYSTIKDFNHLAHNSLNISLVWEDEIDIQPGQPNETTGKFALQSLEAAVKAMKDGHIDVIVTAPINKKVMQQEHFNYPGHTQYLQEAFERKESLMFMVSEKLKVALVTDHVPLHEVKGQINKEVILKKLQLMDESLRVDFGVERPRIAVLGLNPHVGDNGLLGKEEEEIILPAITEAKKNNILVTGPYASDGFFGACRHLAFDGVLAMYHDQGLIPFKFIAGEDGVNYTAGLPAVRTSPDHGTAEDIAGKGKASPSSFINAIFTAIDIYNTQKAYTEMHANPIQKHKLKDER